MTAAPTAIEAAVSARTRAILPVHLYGSPAYMKPIVDLARGIGVPVIEDCAQAHGATVMGEHVGTLGDAGTFSFYPTKNLAAVGDAGVVVTSDDRLATRLRRLREYGWDDQRQAQEIGDNSRLDELQAAILRIRLPSLSRDIARRRAIAAQYVDALTGSRVIAPSDPADGQHAFHLFVIRTSRRDAWQRSLAERSIQTAIHYPRATHREAPYAKHCRIGSMANTEGFHDHLLSLPLFPEMTDGEVCRVVEAIHDTARTCTA